MDSELLYYGGMVLAGMALGAFFFGGLWLTVKYVSKTKHPVLLTIGSVLLRTAGVLVGIWYASGGHAIGMMFCVVGLVAMRILATHGDIFPEHDASTPRKPVS